MKMGICALQQLSKAFMLFHMPSLQQIEQQIAALPDRYIFYTTKEIRYLPKILGENEQILGLTSGFINKATWLIVCTNARVLLLNRGMIYGLHQVQMNLDRIQSIDSSYGIMFGTVRLWDGASSIAVNLVLKRSIAPFVKTVQQAMDAYKRRMVYDLMHNAQTATPGKTAAQNMAPQPTAHSAPTPPAQQGEATLISELERLATLNQQGAISDEEFMMGKRALFEKYRGN